MCSSPAFGLSVLCVCKGLTATADNTFRRIRGTSTWPWPWCRVVLCSFTTTYTAHSRRIPLGVRRCACLFSSAVASFFTFTLVATPLFTEGTLLDELAVLGLVVVRLCMPSFFVSKLYLTLSYHSSARVGCAYVGCGATTRLCSLNAARSTKYSAGARTLLLYYYCYTQLCYLLYVVRSVHLCDCLVCMCCVCVGTEDTPPLNGFVVPCFSSSQRSLYTCHCRRYGAQWWL